MQNQNAMMTVINAEEPGSHNNKYINFDIGFKPGNGEIRGGVDLTWSSHSALKGIHQKRYTHTTHLQYLSQF
jgi:hypothetical protein